MRSNSLELLWNEDPGQCKRLLSIFIEAIPEDKRRLKPGKILAVLAEDAIASFEKNGYWDLHNSESLKNAVDSTVKTKANTYIKDVIKQIEALLLEVEASLIERSIEAGLAKKAAFMQSTESSTGRKYYGLEVKELDIAAPPVVEVTEMISKGHNAQTSNDAIPALEYRPDLKLQLSWFGAAVFGKDGLLLSRWNRSAVAAVIFAPIVFAYLVLWQAGEYMLSTTRAVSPADLAVLALVCSLVYGALGYFRKWIRLGDDRIILSPGWALKAEESGATIEIVGNRANGDIPVIKVLRYTATCPICGGMLKIASGEPDFSYRLVGRCSNSPREHVYSFDRTTKRGKPLITPF